MRENVSNLLSNQNPRIEGNRTNDIILRIPNEPNQAVINSLKTQDQIKCWKHWLKLLQKEQNQVFLNISIEVGSTVGGFNPIYNRWKITGEYSIENLENILKISSKESQEKNMRICARVFVSIPKNMNKEDFESKVNNVSENFGYLIEYAYYSKNCQNQYGLIILFGRNEENRTVRKSILTTPDLENYQQKIQNLELEVPNNNSNNREFKNRDFVETDSQNLTELQKTQLTFYWRKFFGPGYNLTNVDKILNNLEIVKTIITDQNGNIIAACTGETDNLGGIEITEFFAKSKAGEFMLRLMIKKCQNKYPNLQIYTEVNMSSSMPFIGMKCGFIIPKLENSTLQTQQIAVANVKVGNFEENSYNNFAVLIYPQTKNTSHKS